MSVRAKIRDFLRGDLDSAKKRNDLQRAEVAQAIEAARRERLRLILELRSHR